MGASVCAKGRVRRMGMGGRCLVLKDLVHWEGVLNLVDKRTQCSRLGP